MSERGAAAVRIFTSQRCLAHRVPLGFPEKPERLVGILEHVVQRELVVEEVPRQGEAWRAAVLAIHDARYLERFRHAVERGDALLDSPDNPLSAGTLDAAIAAVEATLRACDWVIEGDERAAFAAVRPPGHHAEHGQALGFCFFNNVAIGAEYLRRRHGLDRIAIFDFDVHHGNGTQHTFQSRPEILYASVHQYPFYPGTGRSEESGRGEGEGATLNVPLPAGSGDAEYAQALQERILPRLEAFAPEALLLSAGFDAFENDPLGGMRVTASGFRAWGEQLGDLARRCCRGRVVATLEGGYDLNALPRLVADHVEGLRG